MCTGNIERALGSVRKKRGGNYMYDRVKADKCSEKIKSFIYLNSNHLCPEGVCVQT